MHCYVAVNSAKVADQITTLVAERARLRFARQCRIRTPHNGMKKFFEPMSLQGQPPREKRMAVDQFSL
jgi:hypothetical protein